MQNILSNDKIFLYSGPPRVDERPRVEAGVLWIRHRVKISYIYMYYSYILVNTNKSKTYCGHTNDLNKRILEHNNKLNKFTSKFGPWEVKHFEKFDELVRAIKREKYFKSCAGRKFIKKLFNDIK